MYPVTININMSYKCMSLTTRNVQTKPAKARGLRVAMALIYCNYNTQETLTSKSTNPLLLLSKHLGPFRL